MNRQGETKQELVMPSLSSDFRERRAAFRPDPENILCGVVIAVMNRAAFRTFPRSYRQTLSAFGAADRTAIRTGLGSHSFVGFYEPHPVPSGLISEHGFERIPRSIRHGLTHVRLLEIGCTHITNNDCSVLPHKLVGKIVQKILSGISNLRMDSCGTLLVAGALRNGESLLVLLAEPGGFDFCPVAKNGEGLEAEVYSNHSTVEDRLILNIADDIEVPAPASVAAECSDAHGTRNLSVFPEPVLPAPEYNASTIEGDDPICVIERHPRQGFFPSPARALSLGIAGGREGAANGHNGFAVQAQLFASPAGELREIEVAGPATTPFHRLPLNFATIIPDRIHGPSLTQQLIARSARTVLHPEFVGQHHAV